MDGGISEGGRGEGGGNKATYTLLQTDFFQLVQLDPESIEKGVSLGTEGDNQVLQSLHTRTQIARS